MEQEKHLFEVLAEARGCSVEDIRRMISARIEKGLHDTDPEKRKIWEPIPCEGNVPAPEEWLKYTEERLIEEGREDLLRRYPAI